MVDHTAAASSRKRPILAAYEAFGLILAILSFARLVASVFEIGVGPTVQSILEWYNTVVTGVGRFFEPAIRMLFALFDLPIALNEQWMHIFVLLNLYFFAHVTSARRDNIEDAANFYTVWGFTLAALFSVLTGMLSLSSDASEAMAFLLPALAIMIFATVNSIRSATFYRPAGLTWWKAFADPMRHVIRLGVAASVLLGAGWLWRLTLGRESELHWGMVLVIMLVVFLALYRIHVNQSWIRGAADTTKSWWWRARHSRQAHIGWGMLFTVLGAVLVCAIGAGENYLMAS